MFLFFFFFSKVSELRVGHFGVNQFLCNQILVQPDVPVTIFWRNQIFAQPDFDVTRNHLTITQSVWSISEWVLWALPASTWALEISCLILILKWIWYIWHIVLWQGPKYHLVQIPLIPRLWVAGCESLVPSCWLWVDPPHPPNHSGLWPFLLKKCWFLVVFGVHVFMIGKLI